MDHYIEISIAKDFSTTPGSRKKSEGEFSGQEFRESILTPAFNQAVEENKKIRINLDGVLGYGTSFLEEVFGGLQRNKRDKNILDYIEIISSEEPYLIDDIKQYVQDVQE